MLYAVQLIEAREHSTAKNNSRAPGEARFCGLLVAVASFCGGVWNVRGNVCNLIQNNMRFFINHFRDKNHAV